MSAKVQPLAYIKDRFGRPSKFRHFGPLKRRIRFSAGGATMGDLTVLSTQVDPYRLDTDAGHELGQWLQTQVGTVLRPTQTIHLRGLHYLLVMAPGGVLKLDGTKYQNTPKDWEWLHEKAAKAARWLGYVPFERIVDERNEPPRIYDVVDEEGNVVRLRTARLDSGSGIWVPTTDDLLPGFTFEGGSKVQQPYRIVMIGEKTSLAEVLEPIARQKASELLLPTGDITDTMIVDMARRADADGRPLVPLYFSDFDPSGHHMPTCLARKLQAIRDLQFPDLRIAGLYQVALTADQCNEYDLPESVLKEEGQASKSRKERWIDRWGREQTEIDALVALRPDALRDITDAALRPFFDDTLERRQRELDRAYEDALTDWLDRYRSNASGDYLAIDEARDDVVAAIRRLDEVQETAADALQAAKDTATELEELPTDSGRRASPILPVPPPTPIYTSDDDWKVATLKLIERKRLLDDGMAAA
jgi:hypothetical protein